MVSIDNYFEDEQIIMDIHSNNFIDLSSWILIQFIVVYGYNFAISDVYEILFIDVFV